MSDETFAKAQERVRQLPKTPSNDELLELYGLYKQATAGDATGPRPGLLSPRDRAKFDAWHRRQGMSTEQAEQQYVALVERLEAKYRR